MKKLIFDEINNYTPKKSNVVSRMRLFGKKNSKLTSDTSGNFGWRALFLLLALFFTGLAFISRAYKLQVFDAGKYDAIAKANKTRTAILLAERGVIYSSDGKVLARNKPSFALELTPSLCSTLCEAVIKRAASLVPVELNDALSQLNSHKSQIVIKTNISKEQAILIESNLVQLPGLNVITYPIRDYVDPYVFSHSIGYVGLDDKSLQPKIIGKAGVEATYDDYLTGIPGSKISEVDSTGQSYTLVAQQDALPGRDITLYINYDLSLKAYELLKKVIDEKKATAGVVVAQDPQTGGVLALVNYPSFDANAISAGLTSKDYLQLINDPAKPFFNRAISAAYPPGSTFKMVTASAALSENVVNKTTTIFDPGYIMVNGYRFNNWKLSGHGDVDIVRALQVSNDTFFYTVGGGYGNVQGVGIKKLSQWAKRFGLGNTTNIDIPGEVEGYMPDGTGRDWYLGDTYITSIGQGDVLSTPLQTNRVTTYFANGQSLYKPQIVKSVNGIKNFEPQIDAGGFLNRKNYDIIIDGLEKAVLPGGTAYPLFDFTNRHPGIILAGKTGTSEFINKDGKPSTHAWFTVFGPVGRANIALTVFLEGGGAGSDDASPIAKELLDLWFSSASKP